MGSSSLTISPSNSPNPIPLILTSLTLILTFFIIKITENNISSLVRTYIQKFK